MQVDLVCVVNRLSAWCFAQFELSAWCYFTHPRRSIILSIIYRYTRISTLSTTPPTSSEYKRRHGRREPARAHAWARASYGVISMCFARERRELRRASGHSPVSIFISQPASNQPSLRERWPRPSRPCKRRLADCKIPAVGQPRS